MGNASPPTMSQNSNPKSDDNQSKKSESNVLENQIIDPENPPNTSESGGSKGFWTVLIQNIKKGVARILAIIFHWIVLAGFLVLPGSLPEIREILEESGKLGWALHFVENVTM
jgi:hypothetical protein